MCKRILFFALACLAVVGVTDRSEAFWRNRRNQCCCPAFVPPCCCMPFTAASPQPSVNVPRVRTPLEGAIGEEEEHERIAKESLNREHKDLLLRANVRVPASEEFEGSDRKTPKTTVVHGGDTRTFDGVDELIAYFETPERKQERWWGKMITKQTDERNAIELVNVTVRNAWIYEISRQPDNDYHLLIGVSPDKDDGRYINAEISAINPDSDDAADLWSLRKDFVEQYQHHEGKPVPKTKRFAQPQTPIHIRLTGSIFLDADHGRSAVGHGEIKNFTSWEIHPITKIQILPD